VPQPAPQPKPQPAPQPAPPFAGFRHPRRRPSVAARTSPLALILVLIK
jgi:hypothetical protein